MLWLALGMLALFWLLGSVSSVAASAVLYFAIVAVLGVIVVSILHGGSPFGLH